MSTIKFVAIGPQSSGYQKFPVVDAAGNRYSPTWGQSYKDQLEVGSKAFLGKRINNPHGENAIWELWPITIEKTPEYGTAKRWYGKGRYVFVKL